MFEPWGGHMARIVCPAEQIFSLPSKTDPQSFSGAVLTQVVDGLSDVSMYPALMAELLRRGYSDSDIKKIAGQNVLRVMREVEKVSKRLQSERGPSMAIYK